uniref:Uncharacterized protein n=1 Tax=Arundo donax TaxID=35708 RepID=A0A0A8ZD60_ARUDO
MNLPRNSMFVFLILCSYIYSVVTMCICLALRFDTTSY